MFLLVQDWFHWYFTWQWKLPRSELVQMWHHQSLRQRRLGCWAGKHAGKQWDNQWTHWTHTGKQCEHLWKHAILARGEVETTAGNCDVYFLFFLVFASPLAETGSFWLTGSLAKPSKSKAKWHRKIWGTVGKKSSSAWSGFQRMSVQCAIRVG